MISVEFHVPDRAEYAWSGCIVRTVPPAVPRIGEAVRVSGTYYRVTGVLWDLEADDEGIDLYPRAVVYLDTAEVAARLNAARPQRKHPPPERPTRPPDSPILPPPKDHR